MPASVSFITFRGSISIARTRLPVAATGRQTVPDVGAEVYERSGAPQQLDEQPGDIAVWLLVYDPLVVRWRVERLNHNLKLLCLVTGNGDRREIRRKVERPPNRFFWGDRQFAESGKRLVYFDDSSIPLIEWPPHEWDTAV